MIPFEPWPKTTRFRDDYVYTEKIDGTNACVVFKGFRDPTVDFEFAAQSRNRLITPDSDNAGFARWVYENKDELFELLGEGRHYGEWWGKKIGRTYGLESQHFSLFNTGRWAQATGTMDPFVVGGSNVGPVPVLGVHSLDFEYIDSLMRDLKVNGSKAAPGFMNPEGLCVYDTQAKVVKKVTFEFSKGKWAGE